MKRADLIRVYKDTQRVAKQTTSHDYKKSEKWNINEDLPPDEDLFEASADNRRDTPATIVVVNADTLTTAIDLKLTGLDPLVLNMASSYCPGGGVAKGCRAQEEVLFRRTNYFLCTNGKLYPIKDDEFITTDGVTVIKDENYNVLREYKELDFIAIAAPRKPPTAWDDEGELVYMDKEDRDLMSSKIDSIFRYAVYQGKDSLVLGALGCGAYGNPPKLVRDMFQEALDKYRYYFDNITFAVLALDDKNPNYNLFSSLH